MFQSTTQARSTHPMLLLHMRRWGCAGAGPFLRCGASCDLRITAPTAISPTSRGEQEDVLQLRSHTRATTTRAGGPRRWAAPATPPWCSFPRAAGRDLDAETLPLLPMDWKRQSPRTDRRSLVLVRRGAWVDPTNGAADGDLRGRPCDVEVRSYRLHAPAESGSTGARSVRRDEVEVVERACAGTPSRIVGFQTDRGVGQWGRRRRARVVGRWCGVGCI